MTKRTTEPRKPAKNPTKPATELITIAAIRHEQAFQALPKAPVLEISRQLLPRRSPTRGRWRRRLLHGAAHAAASRQLIRRNYEHG
jgi:hypothetical protein